eukprot:Clim_evm119s149 gene=Clim_evmTU119s149
MSIFVKAAAGAVMPTAVKNAGIAYACLRQMGTVPMFGHFKMPPPENEPNLNYAPGSPERAELEKVLKSCKGNTLEIPANINGEEIKTGDTYIQQNPGEHSEQVAKWHAVDNNLLQKAIDGAMKAHKEWSNFSFQDRQAIFLKAADLLTTKYRYEIMAATMLGQGKTVWQADIDCTAELADFWRFNAYHAEELYHIQPPKNSKGIWNRLEWRPLEGFTYAVSPFNFSAIGGNLPSAPIIMGGVSLWKPSPKAMWSNYVIFKILKEAGLPDGVLQFVPGDGVEVTKYLMDSPDFGGIHFTGSTSVFKQLMQTAANNLDKYKSFPRIVGETGGKNCHVIHNSADMATVVPQTLRAAFEYQGQKCSACSRVYVPESRWAEFKEGMIEQMKTIKQGPVDDFSNFMSAVIDSNALKKHQSYLQYAKESPKCEVVAGGEVDDSTGYYVQPSLIRVDDPSDKLLKDELFGPITTAYVYKDEQFNEMLDLVDGTTEYSLTAAIFAQDREALETMTNRLRNSSGNFYVNDKCTGAVVGQQPFGGGRMSGTNDKAGSMMNLIRFTQPRAIKENFIPVYDYTYPHMK